MNLILPFGAALFVLIALPNTGRAAENRLWLASQQDWGAKRGFYLAFENTCPENVPCRLETIRFIWGVGDGQSWRFLEPPHDFVWEYDRDYTAVAEIGPNGASLTVGGKRIAEDAKGWSPAATTLDADAIPGWAHAPADYLIVPKSVRVENAGGKPVDLSFARFARLPMKLLLFESQDPRHIENWRVGAPRKIRIEATFRFVRRPNDLRPLAPFVDAYGQALDAHWPGKITSDAALKQSAQTEEKRLNGWKRPAELDKFGGSRKMGWHAAPTGYYAVVKRNGVWWLVTPEGNPCFYTGICTAPALDWDQTPITDREFLFQRLPPRTGATASAWGHDPWGQNPGTDTLAFHSVNMLRKYGPRWREKENALTVRRVKAWGFSGLGKWSGGLPGVPSIPVLNRRDVPNVARHPDIFDPAITRQFRESLRKQIVPNRNDPFMVGWSLGNEYDEIINADEIRQILEKTDASPAKRALIDEALRGTYDGDVAQASKAAGVQAETKEGLIMASVKFPAPVVEQLRRFYADRYYDFIYRTVKSFDPHHLYLGFWIVPGWWENEEDWRLIARHCDVIGYDHYSYSFTDASLNRLIKESGKPILCGEFSFPAQYHGERGFGFYPSSVESDAQSGAWYARWLKSATANPYCVGVAWFQYRDEPLTGRGPGRGPDLVYGENFAFGLVDVTDRPKWDLIQPLRQANLSAMAWRSHRKN